MLRVREDRLWFFDGRAHIAVRGVRDATDGDAGVPALVEQRLAALPCVEWAAVNTVLGCAVVATAGASDDPATVRALLETVRAVEEEHGLTGPLPEHPLAAAPAVRTAWPLAVQAAALPLALTARLTRLTPVPAALGAVSGVVDAQPRLRRLLERAVGEHRAGVVLAGVNAVAQAGAGGVVGLAVDTARHALRVAELDARRRAWRTAEPWLTGAPEHAAAVLAPPVPRAAPLRAGWAERYADRAALVAGAAFAGTLALTRRPGRAAGAALAALPKAPWAARDAFTATLGRALARRGVLLADPGALRRLDRVRTAVLDTDVLTTGRYLLAELGPVEDDAPTGDLAAVAHRLFDPADPTGVRRDGVWELGPVDGLRLRGRTGAQAGDRLRREGVHHVLGLAEDRRLRAVISVVPELDETADALVTAARRAGLRVLAAGEHAGAAALSEADGILPGGDRLAGAVRDLQQDGTAVLLLSRCPAALAAADVGLGLPGPDGRPPWGAHVLLPGGARDAVVLVEACRAARTVTRRGVRLAEASAVLGGAMTLAGRRGRRADARGLMTVQQAAGLGMALGVWSAAELLRRPLPPAAARHPWHALTPETVLGRTGSMQDGLTAKEAQARSTTSGEEVRRPSLARAYLSELANPLTPVLGGGAALSAVVGAVLDAWIIVAVTALSGLIGGTQRHLTDRLVDQLHRRAAVTATVVRDGEETTLPAEELVVGDVVTLKAGDVVPADGRLLEAYGLETDESALTGESLPIAKDVAPVLASDLADRMSMVYEGTTVAAGRARAVVVAVGEATEAGRSARAGRGAAPAAGVEHRLARITRITLPVALGSAGALMAAGLLRGRPIRRTIGDGVGLAVASVPEGLPFLVTAAQLAAARRLSRQGALVRNPRTIEAAGRADVLCFDKTGTLTHGRITLTAVSAEGHTLPLDRLEQHQRAVLAAALRATPRRHDDAFEHVTDRAVVEGARAAGVSRTHAAPGWRRSTSLPFEPSRGFHATRGRCGKQRLLSVKGAPEEIAGRCATYHGRPLDAITREEILTGGEKLAAEGHRILAVAELRDAPGGRLTDASVTGLDFLGFLSLADEVRSTAAESVRRLTDAGVQIVMITGDHPQTAETVARELGIVNGHQVVTGAALDAMDDRELAARLPAIGVVARGTPLHKVRVVQAFQSLGRTVAMTGDGANDAPAIRLADIGIVLGRRGTPSARAAADVVVADDRLETILAVLVEGRAMWASVRQALAILVGGNLGEIAFTLLAAAVTGTSPLTARQLLLVNLFTDLAPAIAVALRPPGGPEAAGRLLREGPEASLGTALTDETTVRAAATALGAAAAWWAARVTGREARARTVALVALVGAQLGQTLLVGGRSPAVAASAAGSLAALAAIVQTPGISQFFGCTPLGPVGWATALGAAAAATAGSLLLPPLASRIRGHLAPKDDGTHGANAGSEPNADDRQGEGEDRQDGGEDRTPGSAVPTPTDTPRLASAAGPLTG
ncbi:HAD-IC family P-type ATPase [Streptomyces poonensis]|nr:HAD-IC family P-type ATPase [Streptomyces poonensis]